MAGVSLTSGAAGPGDGDERFLKHSSETVLGWFFDSMWRPAGPTDPSAPHRTGASVPNRPVYYLS